jgi:hypothetical protein
MMWLWCAVCPELARHPDTLVAARALQEMWPGGCCMLPRATGKCDVLGVAASTAGLLSTRLLSKHCEYRVV